MGFIWGFTAKPTEPKQIPNRNRYRHEIIDLTGGTQSPQTLPAFPGEEGCRPPPRFPTTNYEGLRPSNSPSNNHQVQTGKELVGLVAMNISTHTQARHVRKEPGSPNIVIGPCNAIGRDAPPLINPRIQSHWEKHFIPHHSETKRPDKEYNGIDAPDAIRITPSFAIRNSFAVIRRLSNFIIRYNIT